MADGDTLPLIGCPSQEPVDPLFQTKSYWGGRHSFRLWGNFWTSDCGALGTYTVRSGAPWERNDNFGPPYPSFATVF